MEVIATAMALLIGCATSVSFALMVIIFFRAPKDKPNNFARIEISFTEDEDE